MEKIERMQNLNSVIGGDNDDSVDWEDFIIISGNSSIVNLSYAQ